MQSYKFRNDLSIVELCSLYLSCLVLGISTFPNCHPREGGDPVQRFDFSIKKLVFIKIKSVRLTDRLLYTMFVILELEVLDFQRKS